MKDFKDIKEGLLSGQEATMKAGDATAKEIAFAKEVVKVVKDIGDINFNYSNSARGSGGNKGEDAHGRKIQKGDLVLFTEGNYLADDGLKLGVVVEEQMNGVGYSVIIDEADFGEDELDLYPGCYSHYVDACNMVVIARQKDTIKMIKYFKSLR